MAPGEKYLGKKKRKGTNIFERMESIVRYVVGCIGFGEILNKYIQDQANKKKGSDYELQQKR